MRFAAEERVYVVVLQWKWTLIGAVVSESFHRYATQASAASLWMLYIAKLATIFNHYSTLYVSLTAPFVEAVPSRCCSHPRPAAKRCGGGAGASSQIPPYAIITDDHGTMPSPPHCRRTPIVCNVSIGSSVDVQCQHLVRVQCQHSKAHLEYKTQTTTAAVGLDFTIVHVTVTSSVKLPTCSHLDTLLLSATNCPYTATLTVDGRALNAEACVGAASISGGLM
jgi:hypothetical protein